MYLDLGKVVYSQNWVTLVSLPLSYGVLLSVCQNDSWIQNLICSKLQVYTNSHQIDDLTTVTHLLGMFAHRTHTHTHTHTHTLLAGMMETAQLLQVATLCIVNILHFIAGMSTRERLEELRVN